MNEVTVQREKHTIDAAGKSLGRLASEVAQLLRGKHKASWRPYLDNGDFVEVVNIDQLKFTGNKLEQKLYYRHSGYPGSLKEETLGHRIGRKGAADVLESSVYNMLPKNKLRSIMIKRLTFSKS